MGRKMIVGLLLLVSLTACGGSAGGSSGSTGAGFNQIDKGVSGDTAAPAAGSGSPTSGGATDSEQKPVDVSGEQVQAARNAQAATERLVIRTATVNTLVADVNVAEGLVRQLAEDREGFVLSSLAEGEDEQRTATISFKVPAERFDETLGAIAKLALKVESLQVEGQDVTDEYVDLESRLRNLRAVETRLLQFLNDANRTEDALAVNAQLTDIQGQIEQAQGRIAYLKQSAALSTITVSLRAQPTVQMLSEPGWSPGTIARAALKNLIAFGQALASVAIVAAVWSPVWLSLLLVALLVRRRQRRLSGPPSAPGPTSTQP